MASELLSVCVRLSKADFEELKRLGQLNNVGYNWYIRRAISKYLKERKGDFLAEVENAPDGEVVSEDKF